MRNRDFDRPDHEDRTIYEPSDWDEPMLAPADPLPPRSRLLTVAWWIALAMLAWLLVIVASASSSAQIGPHMMGDRPSRYGHDRTIDTTRPTPYRKDGQCAAGYSTSGDFCNPMAGARPAIPKGPGQCPSGWSQSGNACLESR